MKKDSNIFSWIIAIVVFIGIALVVTYALMALAAVAASAFFIALLIAPLCGALYGLYRATFNYIEALNQTLGDRFHS